MPPADGKPLAGSPISFLYVGRHTRVKGTDLLVEAGCRMHARGIRGFELWIVSDGTLTPQLKERVRAAGAEASVKFLGSVSDEELSRLYSSAHCVVIPSRSESIPVVFSEALQFNRPMIVTDVGDIGTLGKRHEVARVVPPRAPRDSRPSSKLS